LKNAVRAHLSLSFALSFSRKLPALEAGSGSRSTAPYDRAPAALGESAGVASTTKDLVEPFSALRSSAVYLHRQPMWWCIYPPMVRSP
jgi:hypothetical protein